MGFPSPCGVRRVRDLPAGWFMSKGTVSLVSVPLRGKEGAGQLEERLAALRHWLEMPAGWFMSKGTVSLVSVPLRGKEGAGPDGAELYCSATWETFPSPCGVRRVRDDGY